MIRLTPRAVRALYTLSLLLTTAAILLLMIAASLLTNIETASDVREKTVKTESVQDTRTTEIGPTANPELLPAVPRYTITLSGDELRLTSAAAPEQYTVLEGIDPRTLRQSDKESLQNGLTLESEEALAHFLEDFSS